MRTIIALLLTCSVSLAADPALIIRDNGYYMLNPTRMELTRVGSVVDQRTSGGDPDVPDTPTDPGDEPTERSDQIAEWSKDVGTQEEAVAMASVMRTMADRGVSGEVTWNTAFKIVLNRVTGSVSADWADWKSKVDAVADGYTAQFFRDVAAGIAIARGIDLSVVQAVASAQATGTPAQAATATGIENSDLGLDKDSAFDITQLIELIRFILQLLQDLGIL